MSPLLQGAWLANKHADAILKDAMGRLLGGNVYMLLLENKIGFLPLTFDLFFP